VDLPSAMLAEIRRQLDIAQGELMRLNLENKRLREALKDIAAHHDVDADECMWIAQRALDQD
jgi:regulator of replication initiation timing